MNPIRDVSSVANPSGSLGQLPVMNCLVLAGGGAKGAYGAGAAKALFALHKLQQESSQVPSPQYCFLGTSAGALNACILAALGPDQLVSFWAEASRSSVLGIWSARNKLLQLGLLATNPMTHLRFAGRVVAGWPPFSLYQNRALEKLITSRLKNVDFKTLEDRNLVICATNYSSGKLVAFYVSKLIDGFKKIDNQLPMADRRIGHFSRINDEKMLVKVLLASTAIPIAFPPVQIDDNWYVDGGVGNNIPIREAAYVLRFLNQHHSHQFRVGNVFCVTLDEPGKVMARHSSGMFDILWRTYDVFEYVHMRPIVDAWTRINREVADHATRMHSFRQQLNALNLPHGMLSNIDAIANQTLGQIGGATKRLNVPLHLIEPGSPIGNLLQFDSSALKQHISRGYKEASQSFLARGFVDEPQQKELLDRILRSVE